MINVWNSLGTSSHLTVLELISQSSNFSRITILRNGVFLPLFSKYVPLVRNKLYPPIKWLIFQRVWAPLILLAVLELISQISNFCVFLLACFIFAKPSLYFNRGGLRILWWRGPRDIVYGGNMGAIAPVRTAISALFSVSIRKSAKRGHCTRTEQECCIMRD